MVESTDKQLVERSQAGDRQAFVSLIERHGGVLAALIRRLLSEQSDREDALQDTLVQAWLGIGKLRDPSRARSWLLQVARNRCRDHLRRTRRPEDPAPAEVIEERMNALGRTLGGLRPRVEACDAIDCVPGHAREAAGLFYLEGLSIAEVAARIGRPPGTVKRHLHEARRSVRERLLSEEREDN
jgi:RNA polymerase sigma-70 factor, ECF subfamily